jgi:hypothetical protein
VKAEWLYLLDRGFSSAVPDKISDLVWIGPDRLLVEERDDERPTLITNLYRADFGGATNLLDTANAAAVALAAKATVPTLEMSDAATVLAPSGPVTPAAKTALAAEDVDALLTAAGLVNSKIEGIARLLRHGGKSTLVVVNDNDFDLDHTVLGTPAIPERVDIFP